MHRPRFLEELRPPIGSQQIPALVAPDLSETASPSPPPPSLLPPRNGNPPQSPAPTLSSAPSDAPSRSQHPTSSPRSALSAHPSAVCNNATSSRRKSTSLCRTSQAAAHEFQSRSPA